MASNRTRANGPWFRSRSRSPTSLVKTRSPPGAAATGAVRVRAKMAQAVGLARLHGVAPVETALALAAELERFGEADVEQLLAHQAVATAGPTQQAGETHSLQGGTAAWRRLGA